jgi:hypothetical protein
MTRFASRAGRQNPILLLIAAGAAVGIIWLSIRAGRGAAILAVFLPNGLVTIVLILMLGGLLLGLGLAASAPRFERLDPQIRSVPLEPHEAFLGTTGIPLLAAWSALAVPAFAFGLSLFDTVGSPAAPAWAALLFFAQLASAVTGAALMELIRARPGRPVALAMLPMLAALLVPVALSGLDRAPAWAWLAGSFPHGLGPGPRGAAPLSIPPVASAVSGVAVASLLVALAWVLLGIQPGRSAAGAERARSHRMGRRLTAVMARWMGLTAVRDPQVRTVLILGLIAGAGMVTATRLVAGRSAASLAPLAAILLVQFAAGAPLALSGPLAQGRWLWRSIPSGSVPVGLSWWLAVSLMTAAIGLPVISPVFSLVQGSDLPFVLGALALTAFIPSAVGRLLPFRQESLARQLGILALQLGFFGGAMGLAELTGAHVAAPLGPLLVLFAVMACTSLICIYAPWREA